MTVAELIVKLNADPSGLEKGMSAGIRTANRFASSMNALGKTLTVAVTAPLLIAGASAVSAAADFDSLRRGMIAVTGSSAAAERQLERMKDVARLPGLGFREAIQGSIRLQAVGISAQNAERYLKAFGNAVATTGGGKNELDRITVQLGQLSAKGKILSQDIRPIIEAAPAVGNAMRQAFGTIDTEAIQKAGMSSTEFLNRLVTQLERLPPVTGGAKNAFENLTDSLYRARVAIGTALLPAISPLIDGLARMLEKVNTINPNTVRWSISLIAVAGAAGPLIIVLSSLTSAVTALAVALGVGLLPLIAVGAPVIVALAALSAMWVKNKLDALAAAAATEQYRASLIGLTQAQLMQERFKQTERLSRAQETEMRVGPQIRPLLRDAQTALSAVPLPPGVTANDVIRRVRPETGELLDAVADANDALAKLQLLRQQEQMLAAGTVTIPPLSLGNGSGTDKLAGTLDRVNDALREFGELSKFEGVTLPEQLPAAFSEQLQLTQRLGDQVDRLSDSLSKLGARAPQGAVNMLAQLRENLSASRMETMRMSLQWEKMWDRANGLSRRVPSLVANAPANERPVFGFRNVDPAVGASESGRLLGDLGQGASIATRALTVLQEGALQLARTLANAIVNMAGRAGEFAGNVAEGARAAVKAGSSLVAAIPAAVGVASALEVVGGFLNALQPVLAAVTLPLRILGEILSMLIIPVMRILFPVFKVVAIVGSYLGETIAKVVAAILNAIGGFIKAIGKLINAITPFANPGNPLVRAGQAMQNTASQFRSAADEMAKKRKELEHLSFDDALKRTGNAADKLSESLIGAVEGFKIMKYRFAAADGVTRTPPSVPSVPNTPTPPVSNPGTGGGGTEFGGGGRGPLQPGATFVINVQGNEYGLRELVRDVKQLARANPEMRGFTDTIPDYVAA